MTGERNPGSGRPEPPGQDPDANMISGAAGLSERQGERTESPPETGDTDRGQPGRARYRKVGRLKPGEDGVIHIFRDEFGEIGSITRTDAVLVLGGMQQVPVSPSGSVSVSASGHGVLLAIPGHEGISYLMIARQVRTLIRDWPKKKAALFVVDEI